LKRRRDLITLTALRFSFFLSLPSLFLSLFLAVYNRNKKLKPTGTGRDWSESLTVERLVRRDRR